MKKFVPLFLFVVLIAACDKDRFQTKPQLKIISTSADVVPFNSDFRVILEYTDKEGDVNDSLWIVKKRLNTRPAGNLLFELLEYEIPEFPNTQKGQFEILIPYNGGLLTADDPPRIPGSVPSRLEPDTMSIKFVVKDGAGNISDTVTIPQLVVYRD